MESAVPQIIIDDETLLSMDSLCKQFGKNISAVFKSFAKACIKEGRIPESIQIYEEDPNEDFKEAIKQIREESANTDISMEEIIEEIAKYRAGQ